MRLLACSDLHGDLGATRRILAQAGAADVVVVAGDFGTKGQETEPVLELLRACPRPVVLVPGNHDNLMGLRQYCRDWPTGHLLHGSGITLQGVPFYGLGGEVPRSTDELWNLALSERQAAELLTPCPPNAVLVTHSPPKGHCDRQPDGRSGGSEAILKCLRAKHPRLHLCGHIDASFGATSTIGDCEIRNLGPVANWFTL